MNALTAYKLFASNTEMTLKRISADPVTAREIDYYKENISNVTSAEELVKDQRLLNFALKAYGLEDMSYATAFMQKLLDDGVSSDDALANQLIDKRYKEFAEDFNFPEFGTATTAFERTQTGVVDKYLQQSIEQEAGSQNTGARLAIYFERKSSEIDSALDILGDPALLRFVQTTYSLPTSMSFLSLERQEALIDERLDIENLQDPEYLDEITTQFLALWDLSNPDSISVPPLISSPFGSQQTLSLDVLSAIQNVRSRI